MQSIWLERIKGQQKDIHNAKWLRLQYQYWDKTRCTKEARVTKYESETAATPQSCDLRRRLRSLPAERSRHSHYLQTLQSQSPACREADRQTDRHVHATCNHMQHTLSVDDMQHQLQPTCTLLTFYVLSADYSTCTLTALIEIFFICVCSDNHMKVRDADKRR